MIDITNKFTSNVVGCSVNKAFFKADIVYAYFDVKDVTGKEMFTVKNLKYYPKIHWRQVVDLVSTLGILLADS